LLSEGAQVIGDRLPIRIEIDGGLIADEVYQQFSLAYLPPTIQSNQFWSATVPLALQLLQLALAVKELR
jgi:hypothetical protein